MYRASGLCTLLQNVNLNDEAALKNMLDNISIKIEYAEDGNRVYLNDKNVSERIREADITKLSSQIAVIRIVREKMVELQRKIGENGGVIMDGRDIGTVVFPNADYKFFMIADVKTRASRRWKEAKENGEIIPMDEIEEELIWRDENDSNREISPLKQATDAIPIDTSGMSIDEQVDMIYSVIKRGENA
jgi:cytidylate kinase